MNKINMLKAVYYIYTQVPDYKFDMKLYRQDQHSLESPKCKSVGCAYGHLTAIVPRTKIQFIRSWLGDPTSNIWFGGTINSILDLSCDYGNFLADSQWANTDNTRKGFCQRVLYLLTVKKPSLRISKRTLKRYQKIDVVKTYNKLKKQLKK